MRACVRAYMSLYACVRALLDVTRGRHDAWIRHRGQAVARDGAVCIPYVAHDLRVVRRGFVRGKVGLRLLGHVRLVYLDEAPLCINLVGKPCKGSSARAVVYGQQCKSTRVRAAV